MDRLLARRLFEARRTIRSDAAKIDLISGKHKTPIHQSFVALLLRKEPEVPLGRRPETCEIFAFLMYVQDIDETARRIALLEETKSRVVIQEVVQATKNYLRDPNVWKALINSFEDILPSARRWLYADRDPDVLLHIDKRRNLIEIRTKMLEIAKMGENLVREVVLVGDKWTVLPHRKGSFNIVKDGGKTSITVLYKDRKFTHSVEGILAKEPMIDIEELLIKHGLEGKNFVYI